MLNLLLKNMIDEINVIINENDGSGWLKWWLYKFCGLIAYAYALFENAYLCRIQSLIEFHYLMKVDEK